MSKSIQVGYFHDGYSKSRGLDGWYRDLTVQEAKDCKFHCLYALDNHGRVREVRLNGRPKTWKRSPGCELSLKYGIRDCFRVGDKDLLPDEPIGSRVRILVPVKHDFRPDTPVEIVSDWVKEKELI